MCTWYYLDISPLRGCEPTWSKSHIYSLGIVKYQIHIGEHPIRPLSHFSFILPQFYVHPAINPCLSGKFSHLCLPIPTHPSTHKHCVTLATFPMIWLHFDTSCLQHYPPSSFPPPLLPDWIRKNTPFHMINSYDPAPSSLSISDYIWFVCLFVCLFVLRNWGK